MSAHQWLWTVGCFPFDIKYSLTRNLQLFFLTTEGTDIPHHTHVVTYINSYPADSCNAIVRIRMDHSVYDFLPQEKVCLFMKCWSVQLFLYNPDISIQIFSILANAFLSRILIFKSGVTLLDNSFSSSGTS